MITAHFVGHVGTFTASRIITPDGCAGVSRELPLIPPQEEKPSRETLNPLLTQKALH